jgi:hypothetical protein
MMQEINVRYTKLTFWLAMLTAQAAAFLIFKDLADISQWVVQSSREFTMMVWYNRHLITGVAIGAMIVALMVWRTRKHICPRPLLGVLLFFFVLNIYSGMINPKWMFRAQQHEASFVAVDEAADYLGRSLKKAHFGPDSYASVDDINVVVLETDNGAYAYSDYYLLQPHVVKGDTIGGEEVIMTYCGLTNLAIAYSPVIDEQELDLTVMTQLKNNLVLFDKNSGEPIQQLRGVRERDPDKLKMKEWPTIRMPFSSFREIYPDGKVFINEIPDFSESPVFALWDRLVRHVMMVPGVGLNWIDNEKPAFPTIEYTDRRLPMKQFVYTITVGEDSVAYTREFVKQQGNTINVEIGGKPIVVDYDPGFDVLTAFFNTEGMPPVSDVDISGKTDDGRQLKRVNTLKSQLFWFIFVEFYPETDVNRV